MTARKPANPGIEERIQLAADHVRHSVCRRCGAPVLTARAGRVAALDVRADPTPVDTVGEILARLDGRLTWYLVTPSAVLGYQRIVWRHLWVPATPPLHPVIADHTCPRQPRQETLL